MKRYLTSMGRILPAVLLICTVMTGSVLVYGQDEEASQIRIRQNGQYIYEYNEDGLCTAAVDETGGRITFSYTCNEDGLPTDRYMNAGQGDVLIETYEYTDEGRLETLTVYREGEDPVVMRFDENGRFAYADNLYVFPSMGFRDAEFTWDENGRLTEVVSSHAVDEEELVEWVARTSGQEVTEDDYDLFREGIEKFFEDHDPEKTPGGKILLQQETQTYSYDPEGRVTDYVEIMRDTPVYAWYQGGRELDSLERITGICLDYQGEDISFTSTMSVVTDGSETARNEYGPFDIAVARSAEGLPVQLMETSTDIYEKLNCSVNSADIGFYGFWWNDTMTDLMGELHGGIAGVPFEKTLLAQGLSLALRVQGTTEDGKEVIYYSVADPLGRQMCEKFTDGKLTMPCFLGQDIEKRMTYRIDADADVILYEE